MPRISVVMSTRNQIDFIRCTVDSVVAQTFADFEFIIVNNGSTDGTTEYLNTLSDPRIRVYHQEDMGAVNGFNRGLKAAQGEFVTWVSSDNVCAPYFLEALLSPFLHDQTFGFSYSAYWNIDDRNNILNLNNKNVLRYRDLLFNRNAGSPAFLYRRALHDHLGWYDESLRFSNDTDMWTRIFRICRTAMVTEPTHYYRSHDNQETKAAMRMNAFLEEGRRMINRYWNEEMSGNLSAVIRDIYPRLPEGCRDIKYFYCVWSLAADFYYHTEVAPAQNLLRVCLSMTPPEHLLEVLQFCVATTLVQPPQNVLEFVSGAVRANTQVDHDRAIALTSAMVANRPPAGSIILSLPRFDFAEPFEREPPAPFSFLEARHPLPPLAKG